MKDHIAQLLTTAMKALQQQGLLPADLAPELQIDRTRDKAHGDLSSNLALMLAKPARMNPRQLATALIEQLPASELVARAEIAGPGFINFFLNTE